MAERRGRLRGIGARLRRRREPEAGAAPESPEEAEAEAGTETEEEAGAEETAADDAAAEGAAESGERSEKDVAPTLQRPTLGDLRESRRASIRERLRAARPSRPSRLRKPGSGKAKTGGSGGRDLLDRGRGLAGSAAGAAGSALGTARDAAHDVWLRAGDAWHSLSLITRQRIGAALGLLAIVLLIVFVVIPVAPCWAPAGDRCAPDDDAAALAPADADAYVHLNLDPETDQAEAAAGVADRLPILSTQAAGLLTAVSDRVIDYERDVAPWSGGELAVVLDAGVTEIERVLMIEVADSDGANGFVASFLGEGTEDSETEGITVQTDRTGTAAAIAGGFLVLGPQAAVEEAVELARGSGETLDSNPDYERAEEKLADERLADAWLSPSFAEGLVGFGMEGTARALRPFDTFVNAGASEGIAAALSFGDDSLELSVRSLQDPEADATEDDFFAALPAFEPTLADRLGADALAYLGIGNPAESARTLLDRAAATAPDLFRGLERFDRSLQKQDEVDLQADVLPILDGEAALAVEPEEPPGEGGTRGSVPGIIAPTSTPFLTMIADGVDVDPALVDLAALQGPIADNVDVDSGGTAPTFETTEIDGVEAHSLRLSPVVDLTYAGFDDELVVGTSPAAIERARSDVDKLADAPVYTKATEGMPESVSLLLYLNSRRLLGLGERLFLATDPAYAGLASDLRTLEAGALAVRSGKTALDTDVRITVGEPAEVESQPEPIAPAPGG